LKLETGNWKLDIQNPSFHYTISNNIIKVQQ